MQTPLDVVDVALDLMRIESTSGSEGICEDICPMMLLLPPGRRSSETCGVAESPWQPGIAGIGQVESADLGERYHQKNQLPARQPVLHNPPCTVRAECG